MEKGYWPQASHGKQIFVKACSLQLEASSPNSMSFEDYLKEKKIDTSTFKNNEQERWQEWNSIFAELSPASFTAQKLYLLNPIRRKYPLKANQEPITSGITSQTVTSDQKPQASKPVFRPKMK